MGTRSTVKFKKKDGKVVLSVYQQYDGYVEGVGAQIALTLKKWHVQGVPTKHQNVITGTTIENIKFHNGTEDLALLYVMDNKKESFNMYITHEGDTQEFDYVVEESPEGRGYLISVYEEYFVNDEVGYKPKLSFKGTHDEFIEYVEGKLGEEL